MKQEYLYEVKLRRKSYPYKGRGRVETRKLWAASKKDINTCRLAGFRRDSIEILSAKRLRKRKPIEIYIDKKHNDLSFIIDVNAHIDSTLDQDTKLEAKLDRYVQKHECEIEDAFEALGYVEAVHDNSYNWISDFSDDIDFKVFVPKDSDNDWIYNENARVLIDVHRGLDAREGYSRVGVFMPADGDLSHFLEGRVRFFLEDMDGNDEGSDYGGEGTVYQLLEEDEYKVEKLDGDTPIVSKDGKKYRIRYFHPAEGF